MLIYNIVSEDRNWKEYNDEVISSIQFLFTYCQFFRESQGFPDRWLKSFTVKEDKIFEEKTQE